MNLFINEIQRRSESESIDFIRATVWENYGEFIYGSGISNIENLTNFQAAFLHLLDEKWTQVILPLIQTEVKSEFDNWYEDAGSYERISMQSIDITRLHDGQWQILFEDDNMDLIVHLYMKNWDFDYTARSG